MDRFVHAQNLVRYVDLLEQEFDPAKRRSLQTLLIEEENSFGLWREKVMEAEGLIASSHVRVRRQRDIIVKLDGDGHDTAMARRLLANMEHTLDLLTHYRRALDGAVGSGDARDPGEGD